MGFGDIWSLSIRSMWIRFLKDMRCVEREGVLENGMPVTFVRIFRPAEVQNKGIIVTGWETFDEHPNLILFEGYVTRTNAAHLERRK